MMDIAVAVQSSGLVAEKKDLQEQLEETREELLAAYKTEQTALAIADSMVVRLETAEDHRLYPGSYHPSHRRVEGTA